MWMRSDRATVWRAVRVLGAGIVIGATVAAMPGGAETAVPAARHQQEAVPAFAVPECLACHGVDLITQQRLSAAAWEREVDKMVRWGAAVGPDRKAALSADLAARFGSVAPRPAAGSASAGQAVFSRACLGCHGADLVEQQRLTLAGWTREVAKMVAWGAPVTDAERPALAFYLASSVPAR
jgi:cytochrome c553